jgi:hypothetical protein
MQRQVRAGCALSRRILEGARGKLSTRRAAFAWRSSRGVLRNRAAWGVPYRRCSTKRETQGVPGPAHGATFVPLFPECHRPARLIGFELPL